MCNYNHSTTFIHMIIENGKYIENLIVLKRRQFRGQSYHYHLSSIIYAITVIPLTNLQVRH